MMQGSSGWAVVFAVASVLVGWVYLIRKKKAAEQERKWEGRAPLPPGSFGLPVLGETLGYMKSFESSSLDFFTQRTAKYGEVFKTHLLRSPVVCLGVPDGHKFLFVNENTLVQNAWPASVGKLIGSHSLATKVGEEHKRARRLCTKFFAPEGLQSFVPRMDATARAHLAENWDGKDRILGMPTMKKFTFLLAAELFVSISKGPEFDALGIAVEDVMRGVMQLPINLPGFRFYKAKFAREAFLRTLGPIITRRRQDLKDGKVSPRQDLLSVLISNPDENGQTISDQAIKDNILVFLLAGHETSSTTMSLVLKYLYLNPECLKDVIKVSQKPLRFKKWLAILQRDLSNQRPCPEAQLARKFKHSKQQEIGKEKAGGALNWEDTRRMKYTWRCVQETLRLQPPVSGGFRVGIKDFEYAGYTIPKGWMLAWSAVRSHKSPEIFPNPDKFDPSRFEGSGPAPYTFIPFGGGPRICLGQEFARTEMLVLIHHLVLNYEWSMVDPNERIRVKPIPVFDKQLQLNIQSREIPLV